ncbi:MAG: ferredoxin [Patescibacteria group bacterium]|nr:ferredoxin [Patescibacteria group bacterium]MDD5566599.1 ferredoxin [Patescibacteria group bacterium]
MKPTVDKEKCQGCGTCVALCPNVFALDDSGKSQVIAKGTCEEAGCDCQAAADSCPYQAISLKP